MGYAGLSCIYVKQNVYGQGYSDEDTLDILYWLTWKSEGLTHQKLWYPNNNTNPSSREVSCQEHIASYIAAPLLLSIY